MLTVWKVRRRLEQLLKRYNRGEIAPVEWLDHLTLNRIQQCRAQVHTYNTCVKLLGMLLAVGLTCTLSGIHYFHGLEHPHIIVLSRPDLPHT